MSIEWNGEGLPPVGLTNKEFTLMTHISCACNDHKDTHYEVVAHFEYSVVIAGLRGATGEVFAHIVSPGSCRPIRTHEQRLRDELSDILSGCTYGCENSLNLGKALDEILAAGYRKGVE